MSERRMDARLGGALHTVCTKPPSGWPFGRIERPEEVPSMTVNGIEVVEAPEGSKDCCGGCRFSNDVRFCRKAWHLGKQVFGNTCADRRVIYVEAPQ